MLSEVEADMVQTYETVEALPGFMIETRTPVVDEENAETVLNPLVVREWMLITEVIKRKLVDPEVQAVLKSFVTTPVSQHLASDALTALRQDTKVESVLSRSGTHLNNMLMLADVPEEAIKPDLRTVRTLSHPLKYLAELYPKERSDEHLKALLKEQSEKGAYTTALSRHEVPLVLKKYAFARDVKLLALGAELTGVGGIKLNENGEAWLPSGTQLKVGSEHVQSPVFLDPLKWDYRRQLKDRVHEIGVDGKKYLLKERKTSRHRDTMPTGHREGLTSAQEYEVGALLHDQASVSDGGVQVSWEKPVGFVQYQYPDALSFAVFEYEEGLLDEAPIQATEEIIRNNPVAYQDEYEKIKNSLATYLHSQLVRDAAAAGRVTLPRRFGFFGKHESTLDYAVFAEAKARFLCHKAGAFMTDRALDLGYRNSDHKLSGAYRLHQGKQGEAIVEIVGFDYELYRKYDLDRVNSIRRLNEKERQLRPWKSLPIEFRDKPLHLATYLALSDADGKPFPERYLR